MGNEWLKTNSAGSGAYSVVGWKPSESRHAGSQSTTSTRARRR